MKFDVDVMEAGGGGGERGGSDLNVQWMLSGALHMSTAPDWWLMALG